MVPVKHVSSFDLLLSYPTSYFLYLEKRMRDSSVASSSSRISADIDNEDSQPDSVAAKKSIHKRILSTSSLSKALLKGKHKGHHSNVGKYVNKII